MASTEAVASPSRSAAAPEPRQPNAPRVAEAADLASATSGSAAEDGPPASFDEAAESAFLAEASERGEPVRSRAVSATEPVEETSTKQLPPLDDLVNRIPANVRDTLEDLFRARFVTVRRLPKKALKS